MPPGSRERPPVFLALSSLCGRAAVGLHGQIKLITHFQQKRMTYYSISLKYCCKKKKPLLSFQSSERGWQFWPSGGGKTQRFATGNDKAFLPTIIETTILRFWGTGALGALMWGTWGTHVGHLGHSCGALGALMWGTWGTHVGHLGHSCDVLGALWTLLLGTWDTLVGHKVH